jgi:hypothetical protein
MHAVTPVFIAARPLWVYDCPHMKLASIRAPLFVLTAAVLSVAAWAASRTVRAEASCPDSAQGETQNDCPWANVARLLIAKADSRGTKQVAKLLREELPELDRALQSDSRRLAWKNLWGRSINFDELAGGIIVHPAILQALDDRFKSHAPQVFDFARAQSTSELQAAKLVGKPATHTPAGHPIAHAGLEHTYGYLFSVLKTSFGYKRARWVEGEIERGFGIKPGTLGPKPEGGTLFANVTYFTGRIAFRDNARKVAMLRKTAQDLPTELRDFDFSKLKISGLEETVEAKDASGANRKVVLRTDLVPFPHPQKNTHLLVYSVDDPSEGGHVLITAFPVATSFVETVLKAENLGEGKPVQTRYNAFVPGVTGQKLVGERKTLNP